MKAIVVIFFVALLPFWASGQTLDEDTITSSHYLDEIVVEANMQRTSCKDCYSLSAFAKGAEQRLSQISQ